MHDDVQEVLKSRQGFARRQHSELNRELPFDDELEQALARLRGLAVRGVEKGVFAYSDFDHFLQFLIVDVHDSACDALATVYSGAGAPSGALLRRLYELTNLLIAAFEHPDELIALMRDALTSPYPDDRYAALASAGVLAAVMPSPPSIRRLIQDDEPDVLNFERTLNSIGHGGALSSIFYHSRTAASDRHEVILETSRELVTLVVSLVKVASAYASLVGQRLGEICTHLTLTECSGPML